MNKKISALNLSQRLTSLGLERSYQRLFSVIKKSKTVLFGSFECNSSIRVALLGSLLLIGGVFGFGGSVMAEETLVSENFDDQSYNSPLTFYNGSGYDAEIVYNNTEARGGSGSCLQWDHSNNMAGIGVLSGLPNYLDEGIYIRYWTKYSTDYHFPGDIGGFENLKVLKFSKPGLPCTHNIEFIYKNTDNGGPSRLNLYWFRESTGDTIGSGTGTGSVDIGKTLDKGEWHKIEIYIKIATQSEVHVQINDFDVYENTDADIRLPASDYTGANQFQSLRASQLAPSGHGIWFTDDVTIVHDGGDLCDNEPVEPIEYPDCSEGQISEPCLCNGELHDTGYCCTGIWDQNVCRVIHEDFEDGPAWDYNNQFDLHGEYLADEWAIITSNPHSGTYCAESQEEGDTAYIEDSCFHFSYPSSGWGAEVFIRFWTKYPIDWIEGGDVHGSNFMRFGSGAAGQWTDGAEFFSPMDLFIYNYGHIYFTVVPEWKKDNIWHEYALYLKMPTSASAEDGIARFWVDSTNNYTAGSSAGGATNIDINTAWTHILLPQYYKGDATGNSTWHIDDIAVWDGIPNQTDTNPPILSSGSPSGNLSFGTTSTTISLDTDETATCKYSETAGTAYDDIPHTFSSTNSTSHSQTITGLSDGETKTYYIRCQDESNNQNPDDFEISFSIASSITYSISNFINLVSNWLKTESGLESDVNGDGVVNTRDLGIMMSNWQE